MILASRQYIEAYEAKALRNFDDHFDGALEAA